MFPVIDSLAENPTSEPAGVDVVSVVNTDGFNSLGKRLIIVIYPSELEPSTLAAGVHVTSIEYHTIFKSSWSLNAKLVLSILTPDFDTIFL